MLCGKDRQTDRQAGGRADMTELIVNFHNFANAPTTTARYGFSLFLSLISFIIVFRDSHQEANKTFGIEVNGFVDMF